MQAYHYDGELILELALLMERIEIRELDSNLLVRGEGAIKDKP